MCGIAAANVVIKTKTHTLTKTFFHEKHEV